MPVIKVDNRQYPLHPGQNRVGSGEDADVKVDGDEAIGVQAIVEVAGDSQAVIRRVGNGSNVRVNGIALVDPTPLMHGDKVEVSGKELLYADDTKIGNTAFISAADVAAFVQKRSGPARATTATGGRLVSLVDGKEYVVPDAGITIGRDASAGVVVAQNEVSRKHAEVAPIDDGYEVRDFSANGVFVNGVRVNTKQLLARSDVIRVGTEEFRFYADVRPAAPAPPAFAPSLAVTMMGMPAVPRPAGRAATAAAAPVVPPPSSRRPQRRPSNASRRRGSDAGCSGAGCAAAGRSGGARARRAPGARDARDHERGTDEGTDVRHPRAARACRSRSAQRYRAHRRQRLGDAREVSATRRRMVRRATLVRRTARTSVDSG